MENVEFEKAIFLGWYCSLGDCTYCYMTTQKNLIDDPKKAIRSMASLLAETLICRMQGWQMGYLSAGYGNFTTSQLLSIVRSIGKAHGTKPWLNVGVLNEHQLKVLKPYIGGVCGAVETSNPKIHKIVCPNKPVEPIEKMFDQCTKLGIKKAMTFIVGMGETIDDFPALEKFIKKHAIDKITFYRLKGIQGTMFEGKDDFPSSYYIEWITRTRNAFPHLSITVGSWIKYFDEIHSLLDAGANNLTKLPTIKWFNNEYTRKVEDEFRKAGRSFTGSMTALRVAAIDKELENVVSYTDQISTEHLREQVMAKLEKYLRTMKKEEKQIPVMV